jgi:NTE family protein
VTSRALVLGGGGLAGIAWELAVVLTLRDAGIDLFADADLVVGTSAGSVVGAVGLTTGVDLQALHDAQLDESGEDHELSAQFDAMEFATTIATALMGVADPTEARKKIAAAALAADTVPEAERRAVIAHRIPVDRWPDRDLKVTAIDALTGEFVTFDKDSGVDLVDAVSASCAVPIVWPPMTVAGRRYIDGGLRSTTNADIAAGHDKVLVVAPFRPIATPLGGPIEDEIKVIEDKGGSAYILDADPDSLTAFGMNPLDVSTRPASARAGVAQATRLAAEVGAFWKD